MLFDTQSPGRRRIVQILFGGLALLMGGGLVLFGIGADGGTGILDAIRGNSNTSSISSQYEGQINDAEDALRENPKDVGAAEELAKARIQVAFASGLNSQTGQVVEDGGQELVNAADQSWRRYLSLGPEPPNAGLALQYSAFYAQPGVAQYDQAARALSAALVTREPTSGLYAQLALYNLAAGNQDDYDAARRRSLDLATSDTRRTAIAQQLDEYEQRVEESIRQQQEQAQQQGDAGGTSGTSPTIPSLGDLTSGLGGGAGGAGAP